VANLACLDQLGKRADRLLDRRLGVDAVLVVEVDVVGAEAPQGGLASLAHVLGATADAAGPGVAGIDHDPELGRQHHLVAPPADRRADQLLVRVGAVDVRGVEEVDAQLQRPVDGRGGFVVVDWPVGIGHPHAAEPHRRDLERRLAAAEGSLIHAFLLD
jgi:hypothetical protein